MDKTVRAKFYCHSVTKMTSSPEPFVYSYKFSAVTSGSDENKTFWRWTPSGGIELSSIRDDLFEVGKEYYVDFTLFVPAPARDMPVEEAVE
jgi:hypothetical protein